MSVARVISTQERNELVGTKKPVIVEVDNRKEWQYDFKYVASAKKALSRLHEAGVDAKLEVVE